MTYVTVLALARNQIRSLPGVTDAFKDEYEEYLRELGPEYQKHAATWVNTGAVPTAELRGMSLERLMRVMDAHPLIAVIMLDRLSKDPDAYRPLIRLSDGILRFVARDAPRGYVSPAPAPSALTVAMAEAVGGYLLSEGIDPPELRLDGSPTASLGIVVSGLASAADSDELAGEVEDLRRMCAAAGEIPDEPAEPLSEVQRIGLVLRLLADLATDDLRAARAETPTEQP